MDLHYLLVELQAFIDKRASAEQLCDLCEIIVEEAKSKGNLRVLRGTSAILRRLNGDYAAGFNYPTASREVRCMIGALKKF